MWESRSARNRFGLAVRWGAVFLAIVFCLAGLSAVQAHAAVSDVPHTEKKAHDNGDGTYTLSLSVTGEAESSTTTEVSKANVVLVLDTSSTMTWSAGTDFPVVYTAVEGTPGEPANHQNTGYYGIDDEGGYFPLYYRSREWRVQNNGMAAIYTGTFYTRSGGGSMTRMEAVQYALTRDDGIIDNLLAQNVEGDAQKSDIIEVAIVNFDGSAHPAQDWTTSADELKSTVNDLATDSGTNWEDGLQEGKSYADSIKESQPDEDVYVIFLTDGIPTSYNGGQSWDWGVNWDHAKDDARDIITAGHVLYALFAWGDEDTTYYLSSLVQYAYTGAGNYNTPLDDAYAKYYADVSDTSALIEALNQIVHDITVGVGYTNVELVDGVTSMTASSVKTNIEGGVTGVKYYRSGGAYGTADRDHQ